MAATKTAKTLLTSQSLSAGASVNATEWNMGTAYGGIAAVKLTNGGTAPTTVPIVKFYVGESTGTKRLLYTAAGDTVNSSVNDVVCEIPPAAMFVNITITDGSTNAITVEAYGQELTTVWSCSGINAINSPKQGHRLIGQIRPTRIWSRLLFFPQDSSILLAASRR